MGPKSAQNLIEAIEKSKTQGLERLLFALGIRFVGVKAAKILAQAFGTVDKLRQAEQDDLTAIDEIGPRIAESVVTWFTAPENQALLAALAEAGVIRPYVCQTFPLDQAVEAMQMLQTRKVIGKVVVTP